MSTMSAGNKIPNWVREAVEGSDEAFASLVQTFEKSALTYATAILGDEHSGRDAVQEAFLIAYTSLDDLKDSKSFRGWLREIVRRRCLRIIRRKRLVSFAWTDGEESIIDAIDSPAEIYIRNERSAELQKALKSLPKKLREVIALFHLRHHSQKQVASLIGIPVSTVKNRLHKARLHLKTKIKDMTDHQDSEPIHTRPHSKSLSSGRFQVFRHRRTSLWLAGIGFQAADAADEQVLSGHRRGLLHNTHICRCLEAYSSRGAFFSELQSGQIQAACSSSSRRRFFISMMRQQL